MTDPQRLLTGGDELESALLTSAKSDGPSKQAMKTTLVALGLGAGLAAGAGTASASTATSMTATGSGAAASMAPATSATTVAGKAGLGVVAKWVGIAAIGGLALWGASQLVATEETPPADPVASVPAVAPAAAEDAAEDATEQAAAAESDEQGEEEAAAGDDNADDAKSEAGSAVDEKAEASPAPQSGSVPKPKTQPKAKAPDASQLGDEVAALDSARKAMADDPDKALEAIEKYQDRFEGGVLGQEAEVLRIEALAKAGKLDQAKALGQAFLAKHPSSPLAKRVRSVLSTAASD